MGAVAHCKKLALPKGACCVSLACVSLLGASQRADETVSQTQAPKELIRHEPAVDQSKRLHYDYRLGPGDELTIQISDEDSATNKPIRIGSSGSITVPLLGKVEVEGRTASELETDLTSRLSAYYVDPHVSVTINEYRSQPVSVLGAVNKPGVFMLDGRRTVAEMIALAGGVRQDAGYEVKLTRETRWGTIPVDGAMTDAKEEVNTARLPLKDITDGLNGQNIAVMPFDVISIPRGEMIYVMGEVTKSGGFVLQDQNSISVLEAVSMAGGYSPRAAPKHAKILRSIEGQGHRQELDINMKSVADGQVDDVRLLPKDVLVIPNDAGREFRTRAIETAIALGTGILIWRR
jgi:polysaccharide export outer membrane protein